MFVVACFYLHTTWTQSEKPDVSPYRTEYNPWFKFNTFQRGFRNEPIKLSLDSLEAKPRKWWDRQDSLVFAQMLMKTGNYELSTYYFDNLKVNYVSETDFWWDRLVLHYVQREYNSCLRFINEGKPGLVQFGKVWFFKKICDAKLRSLKDEKWYKTQSVLEWQTDSTLLLLDKESPEFIEKVITPLENLRFVLEKIVRYIHEEDPVIARTCLEMGRIINFYISHTQAYIALSLGRHYNNWDKEILEEIKIVKAQLVQKKYRIPVFRKYFPRIEYWRFDYEVLKEKRIYAKTDTQKRVPPQLIKKSEEKELPINESVILLIGIGLMFVILLLVLKPAKKK